MRTKRLTTAAVALTSVAGVVATGAVAEAGSNGGNRPARVYEVTVEITNRAPVGGTFQTPTWVGVHDGSFDLYDRDQPVSPELERLAEDGNNTPIIDAFNASGAGEDAVVFGPNGPIAPGDTATVSFFIDIERGQEQFFSYASMVLPSNDAFVANGNPEAHKLVNRFGRITPINFTVAGSDVLDAGSEVNDELPATTAFFGQAAPDTGEVENANVVLHPGFNDPAAGGILASDQFANGDFTADGYETLEFEVTAKRVSANASAALRGGNEVPAVDTRAFGFSRVRLQRDGDILWRINAARIDDVLFAHIHLGAPGENGPVVATLFNGDLSEHNRLRAGGEVAPSDLVGPLAGMSTLDLWQEIQDGNAYINVHTVDFPGGELRGNL